MKLKGFALFAAVATFNMAAIFTAFAGVSPTIRLGFQDPQGLCNSPYQNGLYMNVNTVAKPDSGDPPAVVNRFMGTGVLSSGSYFIVPHPWPTIQGGYTYTFANVSGMGNSCGELQFDPTANGNCQDNLAPQFSSGANHLIIVTPRKVKLTYAGYGYTLDCKVSY